MSFVTGTDERLDNLVRVVDHNAQGYMVGALSVLLLTECVLFLTLEPATGYETSIVTALPLAYWVFFYTVLCGGILLMLVAAATNTTYWKHGLSLVIANYLLYIFLPVARGYRLYGRGEADKLRHLGRVKGLVNTGSLPGIWYPGEHVLMAELNMLGMPLESTSYLLAFLFTTIQIIGIGVLVRHFTGQPGSMAIGLAAGAPLLYTTFHLSIHPAILSFMLFPVIILLLERYRRTNASEYLFLLIIFGFLMIHMHPMTTLFMVGLILVSAVFTRLYNAYTGEGIPTLSLRLAAAFLPIQFAWVTGFQQTRFAVVNMFGPDKGPSPAARELMSATAVSFTPTQLFWKFMSLYGTVFLYFALAGLFLLVIAAAYWRGDRRYHWGFAGTHFTAGIVLAMLFLLRDMIVHGNIRLSRYAILFATIMVGMKMLYLFERRNSWVTPVVAAVILLAAGLGANAAYEPNRHLTHTEADGTEYLASNHDLGEPIHSMVMSHKAKDYALGSDSPRLYPPGFESENDIPPGLGYDDPDATAAGTFGDSYVVTKTFDRKRNTAEYLTDDQQEFLFRYGDKHMAQLGRDPTANRIYANGGFTGWAVAPPADEDPNQ